MIHLHITGWVIAFILLFITVPLHRKKAQAGKVIHMVLRLFYLVILFSGIMLFTQYTKISGELIIKLLAGLWAIVAMEFVTVRTKKERPTGGAWVQFFVAVIIAILLGFGRLPLGIQWF